jgi:prevent-host-death family protein
MKLTDAKQQLSRVVVHKSGLPVVAIISADEYRRFTARERQDRASRTALFETLARFSDAIAGVPDEELERELAKAQAEARAELRAEREAKDRA